MVPRYKAPYFLMWKMRPKPSSAFLPVMLAGLICLPLASRADSQVIVWGSFSYSDPNLANVPPSATNVIALAAGDSHCVALKSDGTVLAWGGNEANAGETNVPSGLSNVVSIAAGSTHSLALRSDGTLAAWGQIYESGVNITLCRRRPPMSRPWPWGRAPNMRWF